MMSWSTTLLATCLRTVLTGGSAYSILLIRMSHCVVDAAERAGAGMVAERATQGVCVMQLLSSFVCLLPSHR